jgi:hypothetical protein
VDGPLQAGNGWLFCLPFLLSVSMTSSPFDPDGGTLRCLKEALTESGQVVSIFDTEDKLRYAKKTYRGMFLGDYDGPFTFTDITRHAHSIGLGVRIDDNDMEAFLARTLPRRRSVLRKSFETDLVDGRCFRAGRSGSEAKPSSRGGRQRSMRGPLHQMLGLDK